jgi:7-cyano-7-deazaguanine synthase
VAESVLLVSGGLDSTVLAYWLEKRGAQYVPLFIHYGQHCSRTELTTARNVLPPASASRLRTIDLSSVYSESSSRLIKSSNLWTETVADQDYYLPYRNVLLLSAAVAFAQSGGMDTVYAAFINSNHAKEIDCSRSFFEQLCEFLRSYGGVALETPFRDLTKSEVAHLGAELGAPIGETFSCQANSEGHCGACPNCIDRLEALDAVRRRFGR